MVTPIPELQMQRYLNDINERHGLTCADATVLLDQCTALQQERDQLKEVAQQAATALEQAAQLARYNDNPGVEQQAKEAIAALEKVGIQP